MSDIARTIALPDGAVLVPLSGELCLATCDSVRAQLAAAIAVSPHLVVDLKSVEFMDCAGLSALMGARNEALAAGGSLTLVAAREQVCRLIAVAGLRSALPTLTDLSDA